MKEIPNSRTIVQKIHPEPGVLCWTHDNSWFPLPKGMRNHALGLVVGRGTREPRNWMILLDGRRWELDQRAIDCGNLYQNKEGIWIPEYDPRVRFYLYKRLGAYRALEPRGRHMDSRRHEIAACKLILRRNGWEVEDLPDD